MIDFSQFIPGGRYKETPMFIFGRFNHQKCQRRLYQNFPV